MRTTSSLLGCCSGRASNHGNTLPEEFVRFFFNGKNSMDFADSGTHLKAVGKHHLLSMLFCAACWGAPACARMPCKISVNEAVHALAELCEHQHVCEPWRTCLQLC